MATLFDRGRSPLRRNRSVISFLPTALVALVGEETLARGAARAGVWVRDSLTRSMRETRRTVKPLRHAARQELAKTEKLSGIVPFYPAIPIIPVTLVVGLATFSTVLAMRVSRRDREITARLDAIESELAILREQRSRQAQQALDENASQPAQLPWT